MVKPEKKIAVSFYESRGIATYPYILNVITIFVNKGYHIDVYLNRMMLSDFKKDGISFFYLNDDKEHYCSELHSRLSNGKYSLFLVYSWEGLVATSKICRKIPIVYFSMELIYRSYWIQILKRIKQRRRIRKYDITELLAWIKLNSFIWNCIDFSITMDKERGRILGEEFRFAKKIYYLPNSYNGFSERESNFVFRKLGLEKKKKILLFTGGIENGFDLSLLEMLKNLSDEYILLLHGYSRDGYANEIRNKFMPLIKNGRLAISEEILSEEEYDKLVSGAYICLAWYQRDCISSDNMYYMGLSSGKLMKYLSCGKPVIAPDFYFGFPELIDGNGLGVTCGSGMYIPDAVSRINMDYIKIRKNVKEYYMKNLEFSHQFSLIEKYFNQILEKE